MTDDDCTCIAAHTEACQDARVAKIEAERDRYRNALERITAERFHYWYENRAISMGYETRKESAVPWDEVPNLNRWLMEDVVQRVKREALEADQ